MEQDRNLPHTGLIAYQVGKKIREKTILDQVSLSLQPGEVFGLLGPNGAGKTTCFYVMLGLVKPDSGSIYLEGQEITSLPLDQRARLGLGYLPQETSVFTRLTVSDNIEAVLQLQGQPRAARQEQLDALLNHFGLEECRDRRASVLSGGEKRRLEIARAMAWRPKYLLLDEPFAGIDPKSMQEIKQFIREIQKQGIGVLLTDHNVRDTLEICTQAAILYQGTILVQADPKALIADPKVKQLYLGDDFNMSVLT